MAQFLVSVEKQQILTGKITVEAKNADEALKSVKKLMSDIEDPLQTADDRIEWDEPTYVDDSFTTTEDVDEV